MPIDNTRETVAQWASKNRKIENFNFNSAFDSYEYQELITQIFTENSRLFPIIEKPKFASHLLPYQLPKKVNLKAEPLSIIQTSRSALVVIDRICTARMSALMRSGDRRKRKRGHRLYYRALATSLNMTPLLLRKKCDVVRREMDSRINAEFLTIMMGGTPFRG